MKKIFFIITLFLLLCFAYAEANVIESCDVEVDVSRDKVVNVSEKFDVSYGLQGNHIRRNLPKSTEMSLSELFIVPRNYLYSGADGEITFDYKNRVYGNRSYKMKYRYKIFDNKKDFYYDKIGIGWKTSVKKLRFHVAMPRKINPKRVKVYRNVEGKKTDNVNYKVDDKNIIGTVRDLAPYESIVVEVDVPYGYFKRNINHSVFFSILGIIILTYLSFFVWNKVGKDAIRIPVISFPSDDMDLLEAEAIYSGKATQKGLTAVLFDLARRGYIKIECSNDNGTVTCIKEPDDSLKDYENAYLRSIFCKYDSSVLGSEKSLAELAESNSFYNDCNLILDNINEQQQEILFNENSINGDSQKAIFIIMGMLYFLTVFAYIDCNVQAFSGFSFALFMTYPFIAIVVAFVSLKHGAMSEEMNDVVKNRNTDVIMLVLLSLTILIPLFIVFSQCSPNKIENIIALVLGVAGFIVSWTCLHHMPKRTTTGQKLLNEILGLKQFIEVAEKNVLETMSKGDPEYFYKMLPYAYIFGLSNKWFKKFEIIISGNPAIYNTNSYANSKVFGIVSDTFYGILQNIRSN